MSLNSLEKHKSRSINSLASDRRSGFRQLIDQLDESVNGRRVILFFTVVALVYPPSFYICLIVILCIWAWFAPIRPSDDLPMDLPAESNLVDYTNVKPGRRFASAKKRYGMAEGSFFLGNAFDKAKELWIKTGVLTQHMVVLGMTGAGKTQLLVSYAVNLLGLGGGLFYGDAKGTQELAHQVYSITRWLGRDDSIRVINFIGASGSNIDPAERLSNDCNPFSNGEAEDLEQLGIDLMLAGSSGGGDNKVFQDRAISLLSAIMPGAVELRDKGLMPLGAFRLRWYMEYRNLEYLLHHDHVSQEAKDRVSTYINNLPGYRDTKKLEEQLEQVIVQHGFAVSYFSRCLGTLSDTYQKVFETDVPEAEWADFAFNNRIFLLTLPALEKSKEEVRMLGQICVTMQKNAIAVTLKGGVEGSNEVVLGRSMSSYKAPTGLYNDEAAFYLPPGYGIFLAQMRGLGYAVVIAGQEWGSFIEQSLEDAKQYAANTLTKVFGKWSGDKDTFDLIEQSTNKAYIEKDVGYEQVDGTKRFRKSGRTEFSEVSLIDPRDMKDLNSGEWLVTQGGRFSWMQAFWHEFDQNDPRPNRFAGTMLLVRPLKLLRPTRGPALLTTIVGAMDAVRAIQAWWKGASDESIESAYNPTPLKQHMIKAVNRVSSIEPDVCLNNMDGVCKFILSTNGDTAGEPDAPGVVGSVDEVSTGDAKKPTPPAEKAPKDQHALFTGTSIDGAQGDLDDIVIPQRKPKEPAKAVEKDKVGVPSSNEAPKKSRRTAFGSAQGIVTPRPDSVDPAKAQHVELHDEFFKHPTLAKIAKTQPEEASAQIDKALGTNEKKSSLNAQSVKAMAMKACEYPPENPGITAENRKRMRDNLTEWIADLDEMYQDSNKDSE